MSKCVPYSQRVGQTFGKLTVLKLTSIVHTGTRPKQLCIVRCECGKKKELRIETVVSGDVVSCGCAKRTNGNSALARTYSRYKSGAKQRGYSFNLTREQFNSLVNQRCHYCGTNPSTLANYNNQDYLYNGIDRKDNNVGYTFENSVTCCITCNRAKNNLSYDEFKAWIERLKTYDPND